LSWTVIYLSIAGQLSILLNGIHIVIVIRCCQ